MSRVRSPAWPRRAAKAAAGAALIASGLGLAAGPGAAWIVDTFADNARIWRLGRLHVDGVTGPHLGALRAARATLADEHGVWLEAQDLEISWRPFELMHGAISIDRGAIADLSLLRRPAMTPPRRGGRAPDAAIQALAISRIRIDEAVFGAAAQARADLALDFKDGALRLLNVDVPRTDAQTDRLFVRFDVERLGDLKIDVRGEPGGLLAHALRVPNQSIGLYAQGEGNAEHGAARVFGAIGDDNIFLNAHARWQGRAWAGELSGDLSILPMFADTARRIGAELTLNAARDARGSLILRGQTPFLQLTLEGRLAEGLALDGPAHVVLETQRLSDIARESPFELGAARFEGELRREGRAFALNGQLDARELDVLGRRAWLKGPVRTSLSDDSFELDGDLRAAGPQAPLFASARLTAAMNYNRRTNRYTLEAARLRGAALDIDARGWTNQGEGEYSGDWRIADLGALIDGVGGAASGRWRAQSNPGRNGAPRFWSASADGAGAGLRGEPQIAAQLLGARPELNARLRFGDQGLEVESAIVSGQRLRIGARGPIRNGIADLAIEASARGPIEIGAVRIEGAADAQGRLTGSLSRPALRLQGELADLAAPGFSIARPQIVFNIAPGDGGRYRGGVEVAGTASDLPFRAQSGVSLNAGVVAFPGLHVEAGQLVATGAASLSDRGPQAQLVVAGLIDGLWAGVTGRVQGDMRLTDQAVELDLDLADARIGDLYLRQAALDLAGPLDNIGGRIDMTGALGRAPLRFAGALAIRQQSGAARVELEGEGALAGAAVATRAPLVATFHGAQLEASLDVGFQDGALAGRWRERGRALEGSATLDNAPIAPLAAIWGERATGRIDGVAALSGDGQGLSGALDVNLREARFSGRSRASLDMRVVADLDRTRLTGRLEARSADGLKAEIDLEAPVVTAAAPLRIAIAPQRQGRAAWSIDGPIEPLWAAARFNDQALTGAVEGAGQLRFGAGELTGDGRIALTGARFEDKITGVKLQDLNAILSIGAGGVEIERFSARDPRGGTLTAEGGAENPRRGAIDVHLRDLHLVDRPDARARGSGDLSLSWEGLDASLDGEINLVEAQASVANNPEAGIPQLDVIEINRPGGDGAPQAEALAARMRVDLDVRVRAPGRVFTRGRGHEAEWSLDMRVIGDSAAPRFRGEARAIRGAFRLSGQPFDIQSGLIAFDGGPEDARINLIAERVTADLTARVNITGPVVDPEISFTSDPALPEDEILPQILFGRSVADLSALEAAQLAASLAAISGQSSFDLVDAARAASGLDRFNVREDDENGGLLVAGGVYLTRDVYLEVARTGLGQAATSVEWTVRPRLVLITSFRPNGDRRASIRWRRETD